jgi:cytochrome c peroxidase
MRILFSSFALVLFASQMAFGATLEISVRPVFAGEPLLLDSLRYRNAAGETLSVTRLSYLLGGFALESADGSWQEFPGQVAWLDAAARRNFIRFENVPAANYRSLRFHVGLETNLNHADPAQFAANHPLNPNLDGLHWNWQGGYIFMALEGLFRTATKEPTGYAYHFARDPNRTRVNIAAQLDLAHDATVQLDFDLAALLNAPRPLSFARDGQATHSRPDDPIAAALTANLPGAFRVRQIISGGASVPASRDEPTADGSRGRSPHQPLYLPEKFTPYHFQMSATFPIPDLPRDNPLIAERVTLGEKLFHETALSKDGTLACASCHQNEAAFSDPRRYSIGVRAQVGTRNAMPLFNLAWKKSFFWDGRAPSLRAQALMPVQDHTEMDECLTNVCAKLATIGNSAVAFPLTPALSLGERENRSPHFSETSAVNRSENSLPTKHSRQLSPLPEGEGQGEGERRVNYPALFTAAFGSPEITAEKIGLAVESFVLTLTSFDSKFDRAMRGAAKLDPTEQRGLELFMTEYDPRTRQYGADCFHCHGGALFSDHQFHNNGLNLDAADLGRFKVTKLDADQGKFSTPSLRNVALTAPYMHDGRFQTLEDVIAHYDHGIHRAPTLDPNLAKHPKEGLGLSRQDQDALVAFLKTLTDEKFATPKRN